MALGVLLAILSGCDEEEQQKVNRSQAQVAEASRQLVQADAKARGEIIDLQRDLQQGQTDLGRQRDQLESDRRQYADQRNRDPILANTILDVGTILACLLPLVLCIVLALGLRDHTQTDSALTEILIEEIASDDPLLLPAADQRVALGQDPSKENLPELPRADTA
jgi:multidrug efflux pump subunit AcrA (membrane-fusion protein)